MPKFITTYFLIFLTISTFAQSVDTFKISGTVTSLNTGKVIPNPGIWFKRATGTQGDSLGRFFIYKLSRGQYKLTFDKEGFQTADTIVNIDNKDIFDFKFMVFTDCYSFPHVSERMAWDDITAGRPQLLLSGGIAPIVYTNQGKFEKKYKVKYFDFGCTSDWSECVLSYNRVIFEFLDKKYGTKWRKEVRKDVIGFEDKLQPR